MLAWCASTGAVKPLTQHDEKTLHLSALVRRRAQLVDIKSAEKNRKSSEIFSDIMDSCQTLIENLECRIKELNQLIADMIETIPDWHEKMEILQSIPGVGPVTATTLLSDAPELGRLTHKQMASLCGVCPFDSQSGQHDGPKRISGGRRSVRRVLFMATQSAIRFNATIKVFYERLISAGKKKMVAITACMHKLLRMVNAMVKSGQPYHA